MPPLLSLLLGTIMPPLLSLLLALALLPLNMGRITPTFRSSQTENHKKRTLGTTDSSNSL